MKKYYAIAGLFLCMYSQLLTADEEEPKVVFQINCDFEKQITKYGEEVIGKREGYGNLIYSYAIGPAADAPIFPSDPILFSKERRGQPEVREVAGFDGSRHFIFPSPHIHFYYNRYLVIHKDGSAVRTTVSYDEELVVVSEIGSCEVTE